MKEFENYLNLKREIQDKTLATKRNVDEIHLIAVSKNMSLDAIKEVYRAGAREFGENRLQEALLKIPNMPKDCVWHFIGRIQRNKLRKILTHFDLIHSVDTLLLAKEISQIGQETGLHYSILLQVNTSGESSKQGSSVEEWESNLAELNQLPFLYVKGLMTIAPNQSDEQIIRACFEKLSECRKKWKNKMSNPSLFNDLSMGMSNDYKLAIECGATMLRIGSAISSQEIY